MTFDNLIVSSTGVKASRTKQFVPSNRSSNNTNIEEVIWQSCLIWHSCLTYSGRKDEVTMAVENLVKVSTFFTFQHPHTEKIQLKCSTTLFEPLLLQFFCRVQENFLSTTLILIPVQQHVAMLGPCTPCLGSLSLTFTEMNTLSEVIHRRSENTQKFPLSKSEFFTLTYTSL